MKRFIVSVLLLNFIMMAAFSQVKTMPKKPIVVKKTTVATTAPAMKNLSDSFSYAMGIQIANYYKQQGVANLNTNLLQKAMNVLYAGAKIAMTQKDMDMVMTATLEPEKFKNSKTSIAAQDKCIEDNKKKPGIITTASGLQYEVIKQGDGPKPTTADVVVCDYKGTFLDGSVFDESYKTGKPVEFAVTGVIKGWTEALQLMPTGSKYKLYVPSELAYGANGYGPIPPYTMLVFEIELHSIKGK